MQPMWHIDGIQDAWHLATEYHNGQKYGGPRQDEQIEYLNHIGSVVFEVMTAATAEPHLNTDLALKCAILHDTLEDTRLTYDDLLTQFGEEVARGVQALTKDDRIKDSRDKMTDSLRRIKASPKEIWAVKMADRITNLYAPPFYWTNEKKASYLEEAHLILEQLRAGSPYLADRLAQKIRDYRQYLEEK
jgi:(p)ppGpp synthase/HD superfamily hydrolase